MQKEQIRLPRTCIFVVCLLLLIAGCRNTPKNPQPNTDRQSEQVSYLDARILELIEEEEILNRLAAEPDPDTFTVQRLFHQLASSWQSVLADNPDSLEGRLIYAKLLANYGDREGSRTQLLKAAAIDPEIAVIHQQLGNYFAEEEDPTRALAYYLNAVHLEPEVSAYHFGLGELIVAFKQRLMDEQQFSETKLDEQLQEAFRNAAALSPADPALQFRYGESFYDVANPDWSQAEVHWRRVLQSLDLSNIESDAVRMHLVRALINQDKLDEAKEMADQVTTKPFQLSLDEMLKGKNIQD